MFRALFRSSEFHSFFEFVMSLSLLDLSEPLLRALDELSYATPTPVQLQAIPAVRSGRDVIAVARTGTGKTAAFALPLLQRLSNGSRVKPNHIRALVLVANATETTQKGETGSVKNRQVSTDIWGHANLYGC